jgi:two-component system, chemotaxis family, protein-glutamate methylesterase/glutaminase
MAVLSSLKRNDSVTVSPIRVLIVDDSAVARAALSRVVGESTGFEIAAALDGARRAIGWLANNAADIVLLDIQMPGLDGLAALPALIEASGGARILVVSTLAGDGARATIRALALGAADTLAKPDIGGLGRHFGDLLLDKMLRSGRTYRKPRTSIATRCGRDSDWMSGYWRIDGRTARPCSIFCEPASGI